ncbi:MAG: N-acetylneuraminate synthase family protein [Deltaproteobacteria bacterium]|nr:N-acetylneuraminate synthase family protein [Deltaproteobacteria bacterium]MBZ0219245.1 N-acetylneuraminate synthase family protein [Deltaproteobacteria bacterium]
MRSVINIGTRPVGTGYPAYVIAEIGSNHDADLGRARELIEAAKYAGADAVKFQSFTAEGLLNPLRPDGSGKWAPHPAYPVLERLTLPEEWHRILMMHCASVGITFLSAPFESKRAALLSEIGVEAFKLASGELTNEPFIEEVASFGKPVILSTGAAYMEEVRRAVELVTGRKNHQVALLHCASLYPPSYEDVNIRAMAALAREFACPVGISDHTPGSSVALGAVALGASIIEKHLTLDRNLKGPDHPYAMEVEEFRTMVSEVRNLEKALGDGIKIPSPNEMAERTGARRSIYAKADIPKGEVVTSDKVKLVRHAYGLEPKELGRIIGSVAARDLHKDMPVRSEDLCR